MFSECHTRGSDYKTQMLVPFTIVRVMRMSRPTGKTEYNNGNQLIAATICTVSRQIPIHQNLRNLVHCSVLGELENKTTFLANFNFFAGLNDFVFDFEVKAL